MVSAFGVAIATRPNDSCDARMKILTTVTLPGPARARTPLEVGMALTFQRLRKHKSGLWFQISDDDTYILCLGFTFTHYSGPAGAECFIHDLKRLMGAK